MRVLNIMLGKQHGEIEAMAVHMAEALALAGDDLLCITATEAWANEPLDHGGLLRASFSSWGGWDLIAMYKLRQIARAYESDIAICHGSHALKLASKALAPVCPVIYYAHTHDSDDNARASFIFARTRAVALEAELEGMAKERIFHIPEAVALPETFHPHTLYQRPAVIGTLAPFTRAAGLELLLQAVAIMNTRGLQFTLRIGGDGEAREHLLEVAESLGISRTVTFTGAVEDTRVFFGDLDLFVLPAHHDAYGSALLHAMGMGLACVSTDAEGPSEIIHAGEDALIVPRNDAQALALALERLLTDHPFAGELAAKGQHMVAHYYSLPAMARRLRDALDALPKDHLVHIAA